MNVIVQKKFYSTAQCYENIDKLYVFGDNTHRTGRGGQAIIRECPNTIGIATKASISVYWSDDNLEHNKDVINKDIYNIRRLAETFEYVVFPYAGLGTGLSDLHNQAPRTFLYLCERLLDEFGFNNLGGLRT